ncbi:MAG: cupin domain-containing protein [Nibricoccus sp.]
MNRRHFLQSSLLASVLAPSAWAADAGSPRAPAGFKVAGKNNRLSEDLLIMGGRFDLKVSARDTGGALCIYDTVRDSKGGPALHLHHFQDEWFYVIRGNFVVQVGEQRFELRPGDSAFAPRKIPHAFAMVSEGEGQMLVLFQPAGSMEEFFHAMSMNVGKGIPKPAEREAMRKLWSEHGMEIVGPPLTF